MTVAHHLTDDRLDRAFDELAGFECQFEVDDFHLYVHDDEVGWQPDPGLPAAPRDWHVTLMASSRSDSTAAARARRPFVDHVVRMWSTTAT